MATINNEAFDGLTAAMELLLSDVANSNLQTVLMANTFRIMPTGVGGFVSLNEDPAGEIFGRRVEATVVVTVRVQSVDVLNEAVMTVTRALLGAERKKLLQHGVFNIALDEVKPRSVSGSGANRIVEQDMMFEVLYEFLKVPEESEEIIEEIPVNIELS